MKNAALDPSKIPVVARLSGVVILFLFTAYVGHRGLYLFDASIYYQYGWLIRNGYRPFVDFLSPVTPLCGMLTAFGYALFGVNFLSGVWVTSLLVGLEFWLISGWLAELGAGLALAFAALLSVLALPPFSVPGYNQLAAYLATLWCVRWIHRIFKDEAPSSEADNREAAWIAALVALMLLAKFHVGVLYFILGAALEARCWGRVSAKARAWALGFRLLPPLAAVVGLWAWTGFDLRALVHNLSQLTTPALFPMDRVSLNYTLDWAPELFDQPRLTLVFFGVFLAFCGLGYVRTGGRERIAYRLLALGAGLFAAQMLVLATSAEAPSLNSVFGALLLLIGYLVVRHRMRSEEPVRGLPGFLVAPLFLALMWFGLAHSWAAGRKSWDEQEGASAKDYVRSLTTESAVPYFAGVRISESQRSLLNFVYFFVRRNPQLKYYFGPELEMMYAATGRLPPKRWTLWSHPGVSYGLADFAPLAEVFAKDDPDAVIISKHRTGLIGFLMPAISQNYVLASLPGCPGWLSVYVKKEFVNILR